jgi:hypothetical protein
VRFQQSAQGRPLDDVTIDAINADGSDAFLDIQAKRTINFTRADANFADVVRRLWATSRKEQFATARYEMAVATARTSTRIERSCQQVLQWARRLGDGASFAAHMHPLGFASNDTPEGRQRNRRVELVIAHSKEAERFSRQIKRAAQLTCGRS